MTKLKVVLIDDESPAREVIKFFMKDRLDLEIVGEAENGFDGLKLINEIKPDLLFLDIQMPKLTGFELLELITDPPVIIFSTAYDEYALKAFEHNAADYLLKPFNRARFEESVAKAMEKLNGKAAAINSEGLVQSYQQEPVNRVVVKDGTKIHIIPEHEILRIAAQDDYSEIVTKNGKYLKQQTMKHFEQVLDPQKFVRVHRSAILQVAQIEKIDKYGKETHLAHLKNGDEVIVSATGFAKLKTVLSW